MIESLIATTEPKTPAGRIIRHIGQRFDELRRDGRSGAWAELEGQLMRAGHVIIEAGIMSPKDWIGMAIDIEQFRKSDQGTSKPPGDFLAEWLSEKGVA